MSYFLDPILGNNESVGTKEAPWRSLESVLATNLIPSYRASVINLVLNDGYHGVIDLSNRRNLNIISSVEYNKSKMIPIKPTVPGKTLNSTVAAIKLDGCMNVNFTGISVSASYFVPDEFHETLPFKGIHLNSSVRCTILNSELFSSKDPSEWTMDDWASNATNIEIQDGTRNEIIANRIYNCGGVQIKSLENLVDGNLITDFPVNGIVIQGDKNTISNNTIQNSRRIDNNSSDMIRGYSSDGNKVLNNILTCYINPRTPFISRNTQGISLLNGFYTNWVIDGNKIIIDHPNGIWMQGGKMCRITNNTVRVCRQPLYRKYPPCILLGPTNDGDPSEDNTVCDNVAPRFELGLKMGEYYDNIIA